MKILQLELTTQCIENRRRSIIIMVRLSTPLLVNRDEKIAHHTQLADQVANVADIVLITTFEPMDRNSCPKNQRFDEVVA